MKKLTPPPPPTGRRTVALFVNLLPDERERLDAYAFTTGRPISWVTREALRLYLDAAEPMAERLNATPKINTKTIGETTKQKRGRPFGH